MSTPQTDGAALAVAISGRRSRRAVKWAATNLIPHASCVRLVNVIPQVSHFLSSPASSPPAPPPLFSSLTSYLSLNSNNNSGNNSGNSSARHSGEEEERAGEIVELQRSSPPPPPPTDRRETRKKELDPYKKLCDTEKEVEIDVLEEEDVAQAILNYVACFNVKNLVLGCASFIWFNRMIKGQDVPETILNAALPNCNVFLVSRRKLVLKLASSSFTTGFSPPVCIQRLSSSLFSPGERVGQRPRSTSLPVVLTQNYRSPYNHTRSNSLTSNDGDLLNASHRSSELALEVPSKWEGQHDHNQLTLSMSCPEIQRSQTHTLVFTTNGSTSTQGVQEVEKLKERLQNTLCIFDLSCKELAVERRKVESMSAQCSERQIKIRESLEKKKLAIKEAEEEKARHIKAVQELEEAKQLLVKEALEKHIAEINATTAFTQKTRTLDTIFSDDNICRSYSSYDIEKATKRFSDAMKIGQGGYGNVYKCYLDHIPVAIKVLSSDRTEKIEEFLKEVEVLTKLRHPHIVLLLGVCADMGCLVYEYMENGSLEERLFCKNGSKPLPWAIRFRILYEVACTLAFLHSSKPNPIVHCDLKPGNILLDRNLESKIGDVGLARFLSDVIPDDITEYKDTILNGTACYMDPEYVRTGNLRPKSDVYAFGLIALQMLTKQQPFGLISTVESALKDGTFATILDNSVTGWPLEESEKLAWLALRCASMKCRDRPDLASEVIPELKQILDSLAMMLPQARVPSQYYCPLLKKVMDDPYIAMDGFTYEHHAIVEWLERSNTSPMTKLRLANKCIVPNLTMREAIQEWKLKTELSAP